MTSYTLAVVALTVLAGAPWLLIHRHPQGDENTLDEWRRR